MARQTGQIWEYLVTAATRSSKGATRNCLQPRAGRTCLSPLLVNCVCVSSKFFSVSAITWAAVSVDSHAELAPNAVQ